MQLTKEEKYKLTLLHDSYVKYFNDMVNELKRITEEVYLEPENAIFLLGKLSAHINAIGDNAKEMDAIIDQLGLWHRSYNVNPKIMKQAAKREQNNN